MGERPTTEKSACAGVLWGVLCCPNFMEEKISAEQIGAELVAASQDQSTHSLPLSTRLFPYIFVASRRMSLRTISGWLEKNHGVSLSPGAISRALAKPEMHLARLAESIASPTRYVAAAYGWDPMELLYGSPIADGPSNLELLAHEHKQPKSEDDVERWAEMQHLEDVWESMPHEVQLMLRSYLSDDFEEIGGPLDPSDYDDSTD